MSAYEIHGIREDGSTFGSVGFECEGKQQDEADAEAYSLAEHYAKLWTQAACVRLYRTPEENHTSVSSFNLWPDDVLLITEIPVKLKAAPPSDPATSDDVPSNTARRASLSTK